MTPDFFQSVMVVAALPDTSLSARSFSYSDFNLGCIFDLKTLTPHPDQWWRAFKSAVCETSLQSGENFLRSPVATTDIYKFFNSSTKTMG
jgi:hypothetical protein